MNDMNEADRMYRYVAQNGERAAKNYSEYLKHKFNRISFRYYFLFDENCFGKLERAYVVWLVLRGSKSDTVFC